MKLVTKVVLMLIIVVGGIAAWKTYRLFKNASRKKRRARIEQFCKTVPADETIFVSVASYRDPDCVNTVFDCFEKAACPFRISVGVCQQNATTDSNVAELYEKLANRKGTGNFKKNLRVFSVPAEEAKGPMYARAMIERVLYQGEKYYLVIDSHTRFCTDWDLRAIEMFKECQVRSAKPVLTTYPLDFDFGVTRKFKGTEQKPPYLRFKCFNATNGLPEIEGPVMVKKPEECHPSLFWGGCFSFGPGSMVSEVPFDPTLEYVFVGEEISMAARLFTHGYDLWTPKMNVVKHKWARNRPTFWEQFYGDDPVHEKRREREAHSYHRLRVLMGVEAPWPEEQVTSYGMGSVRSLDDYQRYCGVSFLGQRVAPHGQLGIVERPSLEDITAKFGSQAEYQNQSRLLQ